jgi:hypothetical protein
MGRPKHTRKHRRLPDDSAERQEWIIAEMQRTATQRSRGRQTPADRQRAERQEETARILGERLAATGPDWSALSDWSDLIGDGGSPPDDPFTSPT